MNIDHLTLTIKKLTTNYEQRTTNNELRTTNYEQRTTNNELRTTNYAPMKYWLKAFRLHTLPLAFSGILLGNAIALALKPKNYSIIIGLLSLLTALLLQILSNLANDYGDAKHGADNELREGPPRMVQSGKISM